MSGLSAHAQAVVDLLDAAGILTGRSKTPVPDDDRITQPDAEAGWTGAPGQSPFNVYAIVWGRPSQNVRRKDLDGEWVERRPRYELRTVGGSPTEADDLRDDAVDALKATPITVAGFDTVHFRFLSGFDAVWEPDTSPPVYYTGTEFELWTQES